MSEIDKYEVFAALMIFKLFARNVGIFIVFAHDFFFEKIRSVRDVRGVYWVYVFDMATKMSEIFLGGWESSHVTKKFASKMDLHKILQHILIFF